MHNRSVSIELFFSGIFLNVVLKNYVTIKLDVIVSVTHWFTSHDSYISLHRFLAHVVATLATYQDGVGPRVVDAVLEEIRLGMEVIDPKYNQRYLIVSLLSNNDQGDSLAGSEVISSKAHM